MKLRTIEISDFGGFPQAEVIDLGKEGKNLLVYGENGSGKSTIFNALDRFFKSSLSGAAIDKNRNLFRAPTDPSGPIDVRVRLVFGPLVGGQVEDVPGNNYEWADGSIPDGVQLIKDTALLPARLDYRAILATHFVHRTLDRVDIYDLLVTSLLPGYVNAVSGRSLRDELAKINELGIRIQAEGDEAVRDALFEERRNVLQENAAGLATLCKAIQKRVRKNLRTFGDGQVVSLKVTDRSSRNELPEVSLRARLHNKSIVSHHLVLNEARLTAIGLCIYLAALKEQAQTLDDVGTVHLKLLVLDDVLIGLDIANRFPVLELLRKEFADWQIIILTHDFNWFDMIRMGLDSSKWTI